MIGSIFTIIGTKAAQRVGEIDYRCQFQHHFREVFSENSINPNLQVQKNAIITFSYKKAAHEMLLNLTEGF